MTTKTCTACKIEKTLDCFYDHPKGRFGKQSKCKPCEIARQRSYHQRNPGIESRRSVERHGVTLKWYAARMEQQQGGCAICGATPQRRLVIDHDHRCCPGSYSCGECVRGLICHHCNRGLGYLQDDPEIIKRALAYLD